MGVGGRELGAGGEGEGEEVFFVFSHRAAFLVELGERTRGGMVVPVLHHVRIVSLLSGVCCLAVTSPRER